MEEIRGRSAAGGTRAVAEDPSDPAVTSPKSGELEASSESVAPRTGATAEASRKAARTAKRRRNNETKPNAATASHDLVRQWQANRRNAAKSTGPITPEGKEHSRCNAVRHGLTAETVIGALEDAEDYKAFEAAIIADYDAQSAVERELVLRLASALWRLRRATAMETGLFEIEAEHLSRPGIAQLQPPARRGLCLVQIGDPGEMATCGIDGGCDRQRPPGSIRSRGTCRRSQPPPCPMLFASGQSARLARSTGSAATNTRCGARSPRSCSRSTTSTAESRRRGGVGCAVVQAPCGRVVIRALLMSPTKRVNARIVFHCPTKNAFFFLNFLHQFSLDFWRNLQLLRRNYLHAGNVALKLRHCHCSLSIS